MVLEDGGEGRQRSEAREQLVFLTDYSEAAFQHPHAFGVANVREDVALVRNSLHYSTGTLSHEILHLVLEERGHDVSCFADKVHENQFNYVLLEMGDSSYPVIKKFDC